MKTRMFFSLLATAAIAFLGLAILPQAETAQKAAAAASLQPLDEAAWDYDKARHLLCRAGFGGPPEEVAKLHAMGLRKAVDYLVDYHKIPDVSVELSKAFEGFDPPSLAKLSFEEHTSKYFANKDKKKAKNDVQYIQELRRWWVTKMIKSPRPLEEKLVLFWHGIFATEWRTVRNSRSMALQNQLLRQHAAGDYSKMLHGMLFDAAMLRYLDNNANKKGKPNENLAREIMELFSMGEGQGYTEKDVQQAARALTGYTYNTKTLAPVFNAKDHDTSSDITILGQTGKFDGPKFVNLILEQPATSRFIANRLFTYFVYDNPSEELITPLAKIIKDNKYHLVPYLKTVFLSREFYSPKAMGAHYKSPAQLVAGTIRTLGVKEYNPEALVVAMRNMNQELFDPPNVAGWDGGEAWINSVTLFARSNFTTTLISKGLVKKPIKKAPKRAPKLQPPVDGGLDFVEALKNKKLNSAAAVVDYYTKALLLTPVNEQHRNRLVKVLGDLPPQAQWPEHRREVNQKIGSLLILIMSMPEYQLA